MSSHQERILDQFTEQAVPFSNAPAIRDAAALQLLVEVSGANASDRVLDVACGPGLVVKAFATVAEHVTGIDLTPAMITRAREHAAECSNVHFDTGDVAALPYPDASFSLVVSRFAFHHFVEPAAVLREMRRVCKPDGRVMVCDLLASDEPQKAHTFHAIEMLRDPSHARALTLAELEALFDHEKLARRRTVHTCLPFDLEGILARSFPRSVSRDELRERYVAALSGDATGLQLRRVGDQICGAYTVAVIVADPK